MMLSAVMNTLGSPSIFCLRASAGLGGAISAAGSPQSCRKGCACSGCGENEGECAETCSSHGGMNGLVQRRVQEQGNLVVESQLI